ncbi:MAG: hypothetical protein QOH06_3903 [Acidobacteriota bacterium]|jgi:hypothetical protein|nr:hypothetical protein [Acidobacteriota bacterium]
MSLEIDPAQREVLLAEIEGVLATVREPGARARYEDLAGAVATGNVEEPHLGPLEALTEMSLQTGRARKLHGAESEQALLRLFHRTPRGAAARQATESVNRALRELAGQVVEEMLFTVQAPGVYRLGLRTDRVRLALEIDRHGVTVQSLEI